jgi:ParB-like chromosome segregation protein Spo0J
LEIEIVNIHDLVPYGNNAKEHPKEQIEQIKKSIIDFNNNDPIAIDENNIIIEGHGRYEALKELGYEQVECIRLDHLNDDQKKAYRLVHNKLTMNSDFNFDLLEEELRNIDTIDMQNFDFSLKDFGYEEKPKKEKKDLSNDDLETYEVIVECANEMEQEQVYEKLVGEGYICRVLTL